MSDTASRCWHCSKYITQAEIFCPYCTTVQPSHNIDHFARLGLKCDFEIGMKNLEVAYFAMQRKLHPDLFVRKSEKEKAFSIQHTIDLNNAFEALKSPLKRAEYILQLSGVTVNRDNGSSVRPAPQLLAETLDDREALEKAATPGEVREIAVKTAEKRIVCIDAIKHLLAENMLDMAAQEVIRLRYLEKLGEEIRKRMK